MLRLITFGGLAVREEPYGVDRSVPRRGLAVLALLAAAPESGVSRETIAAYLWPESDEERGRNALRQTLHALRRDLDAPDLLAGGAALRLNPAVITSDLREFEAARAAGDLALAIGSYAGPFLDGYHLPGAAEFDQWAARKRAEYAARAGAVLETLAREDARAGRPQASAEWWRQRSALDPLDTRIARELITALAAAGNVGAAARAARTHEALIREELGTAPDAEFLALAARLWAGPGARANAAAPASPEPEQDFESRLRTELAGRYVLEGRPEAGRDGRIRSVAARDVRHNRAVTIRVIHPAVASTLDTRRFVREIEVTGRLLHPHIVPLLDSGEVAGRPWYAVPRTEGETLRDRLVREGRVGMAEAVRLASELADALTYAHAKGVVHRDVAPENIILAGGHALLANLGVARALDSAAENRLTDTGMVVGTPAYMSPEQARDDREVDGRADVYSLAAVVFEMLAGEPLFSGPTPQAIMAKRFAHPTAAEELLAPLPRPLRAVLTRALADRPSERWSSPVAFAAALAEAVSTGG
jgi:serine/threonine protein kinase